MPVDSASRLADLLVHTEGAIKASLVNAIGSAVNDPQLIPLLAAEKYDEASKLVGNVVGTEIANSFTLAYMTSGTATAQFLSGTVGAAVSFDQVNQRAVQQVKQNRLDLIRGFTAQQRNATRIALTSGTERGLNPRDQAREFRASVGLTPNQQKWVSNYRAALERTTNGSVEALRRELRDRRFDRSVRGAASGKRAPLTAAEIDRMVTRYRERAIKYRSEVIARTEALRAVHQGSFEMYQQAVDNGQIDEKRLTRTWVTAKDERVRSSHRRLNNQKRGLKETWRVTGGKLRYPGDPQGPVKEVIQCRCTLATRYKTAKPTRTPSEPTVTAGQPEPSQANIPVAPLAEAPPTTTTAASRKPQPKPASLLKQPTTTEEWEAWRSGGAVARARRKEFTDLDDYIDETTKQRNDLLFSSKRDIRTRTQAMQWIRDDVYDRISKKARSGVILDNDEQAIVDAVAESAKPLSKRMLTFRGIRHDERNPMNYKAGDIVSTPMPASTSYDLQTSTRFASGDTLWVIHPRPKARAMIYNDDEYEVLYPEGTKFKILSIDSDHNYKHFVFSSDGERIVKRVVTVEALAPGETE